MSPSAKYVMVGLEESGKSTFLGALYHRLRRASSDGLTLQRLPQERDYLIELEDLWLSLKPLQRSRHPAPKEVRLAVRDRRGQSVVLDMPDIVGEDHRQAWEHGGWDETAAERLLAADGYLFFIRADTIEVARLMGDDHAEGGDTAVPEERRPWTPRDSPTQAIVCDLLEQLDDLRDGALPPVALVLSAWDTVADLGLNPGRWVEWKMPLLWQWLTTRTGLAHEIFGISAQGGDLTDPNVRRLISATVEDRPVPQHGSELSEPIEWLLRQKL